MWVAIGAGLGVTALMLGLCIVAGDADRRLYEQERRSRAQYAGWDPDVWSEDDFVKRERELELRDKWGDE